MFARGIRQCIDLTYAAAAHQTIWEYAPASRAAEDYTALIDHLAGAHATTTSPYATQTTRIQPAVH
jgi:hypothetical protein